MLLIQFVGRDELCRRFMAIPGVGPVTALSFKAAVDDPTRVTKSKTVGAHSGLTSRRIQSGDTMNIDCHISKCGDGEVRTALYQAASTMLVHSKKWCAVKGVGRQDRGESRPQARRRRGGAQARRHHASDVDRRQRVPHLGAGRVLGLAEKRSEEDAGDYVVSAPAESIEALRNDETTTN